MILQQHQQLSGESSISTDPESNDMSEDSLQQVIVMMMIVLMMMVVMMMVMVVMTCQRTAFSRWERFSFGCKICHIFALPIGQG